jgi:hypothetical protein
MRRRSRFELAARPAAPRRLARGLLVLKSAALGGVLSLLVLAGIHATAEPTSVGQVDSTAGSLVIERAMTSQQCSQHGFDKATVPASALIRTATGRVKVVTFAHGWDVYQGRRPGQLIAVCLREKPVAS